MRICSFKGCGRRHYALGLCKRHWGQQRRGYPLTLPAAPSLDELDEMGWLAEKVANVLFQPLFEFATLGTGLLAEAVVKLEEELETEWGTA